MRRLVWLMGLGTVLFGIAPAIAPRWFGRCFDLPVGDDPRLLVMVRSVGMRDAVIGLMLMRAASGGFEPWLGARIACDAGDTLAVGIAVAAGARQPRFLGLGALAAGATATGVILRALARRDV